MLAKIEVRSQEEIEREEQERRERLMRALQAQHAELPGVLPPGVAVPPAGGAPAPAPATGALRPQAVEALTPFVRGDRKVGRNEPCPCGSGRKFKQCHGALES
jgi:preprotein translocase subunit SecA